MDIVISMFFTLLFQKKLLFIRIYEWKSYIKEYLSINLKFKQLLPGKKYNKFIHTSADKQRRLTFD